MKTGVAALILCLTAASMAQAAGPVDPDWPCVQRRQPKLSLAQVWSGPEPDAAINDRSIDSDIKQLSAFLALRRTSMEEAGAAIEKFASTADPTALQALFVASFAQIQSSRDRVMAGITRYAHQQEALDASIQTQRKTYAALMAAEPPDFDAIDKAEAEIDWATRIFQDRQQALTYVCETPVILEQRAFALGRLIAAKLPK